MTDKSSAEPRVSVRLTLARRLADHTGVRYLAIGGSSFVLDFGLILVFHDLIGWPVWLATGIAFLTTFVYNYSVQRAFAFSSRAAHGGALVKYTLLVAVNTVVTVLVVSLFNSTIVGWAGGKVIATIVTMAGNYFAYRFWIFPSRQRSTESK